MKHYDNFGTIVNEPELRRQEEPEQEDKKRKQQLLDKPRQTEQKQSVSTYQQRWGSYEPSNDGIPLIDFWKSYWKNSTRLLMVMMEGKYLEKTEKFAKKLYRHMEKEWSYLNQTLKTWFGNWKARRS